MSAGGHGWRGREFATLDVAEESGVLTVRLDRPESLNALNVRMRGELADLWEEVGADPLVRVVVIAGTGRAFCAGADMKEFGELAARADGDSSPRDYVPSAHVAAPILVAVNGACIGGALRLVADADVVLASDRAWFSDPHVSLGQTSGPVAVALAAKSSATAVAPLVLAGGGFRWSADAAKDAGLVSEVVTHDALEARVGELATAIAAQSPAAVRRTVALLRAQAAPDPDLMAHAWQTIDEMWQHPDSAEGPAAARERRRPQWSMDGTDHARV